VAAREVSLDLLRTFHAVHRTGTLTAAAGVAAGVVVRCRLGLADDLLAELST
jgi:hypothetical protein